MLSGSIFGRRALVTGLAESISISAELPKSLRVGLFVNSASENVRACLGGCGS